MSVPRLVVEVRDEAAQDRLREILPVKETDARLLEGREKEKPLLTPAEQAVLRAFTHCDTNKEIARFLGVSASTVHSHAKSIFRKLEVKSRSVAIVKALQVGLLDWQDIVSVQIGEKNPPNG